MKPWSLADGAELMSGTLGPVALRLEEYALATALSAPDGLARRVMSVVAVQAPPTPPVQFIRALASLSFAAALDRFAASLGAVLGVGRSFPPAVRAQALAVVLAVSLAFYGGSAAAAAGAGALLRALQPPAPVPQVVPQPTESPEPTESPDSTETPPAVEPSPRPKPAPGDVGDEPEGDDEDGDDESGDDAGDETHDGETGGDGFAGGEVGSAGGDGSLDD